MTKRKVADMRVCVFNCSYISTQKHSKNTINSENIAEKYTKYYNSKTTDTVLAGLALAESVGHEGLILFSPVRNTRKF